MTPLISADLDGTLIHSLTDPGPEHVRVGPSRTGSSSYMSRTALDTLAWVASRFPFVPATSRREVNYLRLDLGFVPLYAVVESGAGILLRGSRDPRWDEHVNKLVDSAEENFTAAREVIARLAGRTAEVWLAGPHVWCADGRVSADPGDVQQARTWGLEHGWTLSVQGTKIHLAWNGITKADALREIRDRVNADHLVAAGDSILDVPMLQEARRGFVPAAGELHEVGWTAPHLSVVAPGSSGVASLLTRMQDAATKLCEVSQGTLRPA